MILGEVVWFQRKAITSIAAAPRTDAEGLADEITSCANVSRDPATPETLDAIKKLTRRPNEPTIPWTRVENSLPSAMSIRARKLALRRDEFVAFDATNFVTSRSCLRFVSKDRARTSTPVFSSSSLGNVLCFGFLCCSLTQVLLPGAAEGSGCPVRGRSSDNSVCSALRSRTSVDTSLLPDGSSLVRDGASERLVVIPSDPSPKGLLRPEVAEFELSFLLGAWEGGSGDTFCVLDTTREECSVFITFSFLSRSGENVWQVPAVKSTCGRLEPDASGDVRLSTLTATSTTPQSSGCASRIAPWQNAASQATDTRASQSLVLKKRVTTVRHGCTTSQERTHAPHFYSHTRTHSHTHYAPHTTHTHAHTHTCNHIQQCCVRSQHEHRNKHKKQRQSVGLG